MSTRPPCRECGAKHYAKGLCETHYTQQRYRLTTREWNPVDRRDAQDTAQRLRFMRALGEELRANGAHDYPAGSLGHHLSLQSAWRAAQARCDLEAAS